MLVIWLYFRFFKIPKIKNIVFIDGSLGSGKSFYSVNLAIRLYRRNVRQAHIKRWFLKHIFNFGRFKGRWKDVEEPLLYTNIPLRNIEHVILTKDLLFRKNYRFAYKSVVLIDEMSLVADQMLFKNPEINERLSQFFKLFRHETRGGTIVVNSQQVSDCHYSLKYVLSDYFYLHSRFRIPFFTVLRMQECGYSADGNLRNTLNDDVESSLRYVLVPTKYVKSYDTYCYSIFTDKLPIYKKVVYKDKNANLKADCLVSFKDFHFLYENMKKGEVAKDEGEKKESQ